METQQITLNIPTYLYEQLKTRADQTGRSIEAELLEAASTITAEEYLAPEIESELAQLASLDDTLLWRAARSHLPKKDANRLEELHLKKQREKLSAREIQTIKNLLRRYERFMLVRAKSAAILQERGHDISRLIQPE